MRVALGAVLVFTTGACRISLEDDGGDDVGPDAAVSATCQEATEHSDLAWIQDNVFGKSCAFSGCHRGPALGAGSLSLEKGLSHGALVGKAATTESGWMRVVAGNVDTSYLMIALGVGDGPRPSSGVMPLNGPPLCQEKLDAVARWIAAGAEP
jgi:hypothetical protein